MKGGYTGVVQALLEQEPAKCADALCLARCPSAGLPLADDHMHANVDMVHVINVARSQGITLSTHVLTGVFVEVACYVGDAALASSLVEAGADPIHWQQASCMPFATPLLHAASRGFDSMVAFLLDAKAEVDQGFRVQGLGFRV